MITVVCGFPRSGSSLMMRILYDSGMEVYAKSLASFEHSDVLSLPSCSTWMSKCEGKAVKILDPHRHVPPRGYEYRFLWMERNHVEQAKSQIKFLKATGMNVPRTAVGAIARSMEQDEPIAAKVLAGFKDSRIMRVRFGRLISKDESLARRIAEFVGLPAIDYRSVVHRSPLCLPGMGMEAGAMDWEDAKAREPKTTTEELSRG